MLKDKFKKSDLLFIPLCLLVAVMMLMPGKDERNYDTYFHLFLVGAGFTVTYAIIFKKRILDNINKEILMVWNLVFLYMFSQYSSIFQTPIISIIVILLSILVIINAFFNFDSHYYWKVYFYIWFLIIIVGITSSHFAYDKISFFFNHGYGLTASPIDMLFIGGSFLYLAVNIYYIIELIPLPGKHQSLEQRLTEVKADMAVLASEYDTENIKRTQALSAATIVGCLLAINFSFHLISDSFLIPVIITLSHFFVKKQSPTNQTISNQETNDEPNDITTSDDTARS